MMMIGDDADKDDIGVAGLDDDDDFKGNDEEEYDDNADIPLAVFASAVSGMMMMMTMPEGQIMDSLWAYLIPSLIFSVVYKTMCM